MVVAGGGGAGVEFVFAERSSGREETLNGSGWEFIEFEEFNKVISSVFVDVRWASFRVGILSVVVPVSEIFSEVATSFRLVAVVSGVRAASDCEGVEV